MGSIENVFNVDKERPNKRRMSTISCVALERLRAGQHGRTRDRGGGGGGPPPPP